VVEWGTLAILVFLTRYRIGNLMTTVKDVQVVRILDRLRVLMAYSCITLVLECFGMGMMDFDIVAWHSAFKADGEAHGTNRIVYDPTHPFMTDLMTTIYSTGFAFVPLPVIMYEASEPSERERARRTQERYRSFGRNLGRILGRRLGSRAAVGAPPT
jgi:hypothetical protein